MIRRWPSVCAYFPTSRYEGPTGIVGSLNDACKRQGLPAISIWANVPHYIAASPNIKAAMVLVRRVFTLLDFSADLGGRRVGRERF